LIQINYEKSGCSESIEQPFLVDTLTEVKILALFKGEGRVRVHIFFSP